MKTMLALAVCLLVYLGAYDGIAHPAVVYQAKTTDCSHKLATVTFSRSRYPHIIAHIIRSWDRGYPHILTIHREGADARRAALLRSYPTRPGYDRDEAPAAVLRSTVRADVAYVSSSENRSAGASLGAQIRAYCDGAPVTYRFTT